MATSVTILLERNWLVEVFLLSYFHNLNWVWNNHLRQQERKNLLEHGTAGQNMQHNHQEGQLSVTVASGTYSNSVWFVTPKNLSTSSKISCTWFTWAFNSCIPACWTWPGVFDWSINTCLHCFWRNNGVCKWVNKACHWLPNTCIETL